MSNSTEEQSTETSLIYVFNIIGEIIIAFASVAGNALVLALIMKDKQLHTVTNYFIASLAAADLLVGALGIPCVLIAWHRYPHNFIGCLTVNSMIVVLTQISIFGLLTIAIERFIAIKEPFKYKEFCTGKTAAICISVTWCFAILVGMVPLFGWNLGPTTEKKCSFTEVISLEYMVYFNFLGFVLVPLIAMFAIYVYIFHVVQKQRRQISTMQVVDALQANVPATQSLKRETKAAKWFAIVILVFTLCWLPIHIMNAISLASSKSCTVCVVLAILLSHSNSAINPLLYAYGNTKFRLALLRILGESPANSGDLYNAAAVPTVPSITAPLPSQPPLGILSHNDLSASFQSSLPTVPE